MEEKTVTATLCAGARRGSKRFVCVILGSPDERTVGGSGIVFCVIRGGNLILIASLAIIHLGAGMWLSW